MCMQLSKSGEKICKCKFANVCKLRMELERIPFDRRDKAFLVAKAHCVLPPHNINIISNRIYPPINFADC